MKSQISHTDARFVQRSRARAGFTLVEILVVLAIIAILAAILLPVFNSARENSKQVNCASNLQQISVAVKLYYQDEKKYPSSLAFLLPQDDKLNYTSVPAITAINGQPCDTTTKICPNPRGTGYLKSPKLLCPDDDTTATGPRSSYADTSTDMGATNTGPKLAIGATEGTDAGRYVWNFWGYKGSGPEAGFIYTQAEACATSATPNQDESNCIPTAYANDLKANPSLLRNPGAAHDPNSNPIDPRLVPRMANRYAPENTIITHCVYHRVPTSSGLAQPQQLYAPTTTPENRANSKDIVLRLSGAADVVDVTTWEADPTKPWATQRQK